MLKSDDEGEGANNVDLDAVSIHGDDELDDIDKEIKGLSEGAADSSKKTNSKEEVKKEQVTPVKKEIKNDSDSEDEGKKDRQRFKSERPKEAQYKIEKHEQKRDFKKHDDRNWNRRDVGRGRGRGGPMM